MALHTPSEVKAAVTGNGRADKAQVTAMVTRLLRLADAAAPGRRRRRAGAGHLPHLARRRRRPGCALARACTVADDERGASMIAHRARRRCCRRRAGRRRHRGRRGRAARAVHPRHPGRAAGRASRRRLATALVVREDSLTLFGFAADDERNVFELLQTASGVGPRLAQAMLAVHAPDALRRAVVDRGPERADQGARHRQEGRRSGSCSS